MHTYLALMGTINKPSIEEKKAPMKEEIMNREEVELCAGALRGGTSRGAWKALARRRTEQAGADRSHQKSSQSSTERQKREFVHQIVDARDTEGLVQNL